MDKIMAIVPQLMTIIGILAFLVSVIVQVIKNIGFLAKIPTDSVVIVLSLILSLLAFFTYAAMYSVGITWYYVVGTVMLGFIVAYIAMYGWSKLAELYDRFKKQ